MSSVLRRTLNSAFFIYLFNIPRIINQLPNHIGIITGGKHASLIPMAVLHVRKGEINKINADEDVRFLFNNEKQRNSNTKENAIKDEWKTVTKKQKNVIKKGK